MERDQIIVIIKKAIKETINREIDDDMLGEDVDIIQTIGINSIDAISILVKIEELFNIEIEDEDLSAELIRTCRNLSDYVEKRLV